MGTLKWLNTTYNFEIKKKTAVKQQCPESTPSPDKKFLTIVFLAKIIWSIETIKADFILKGWAYTYNKIS